MIGPTRTALLACMVLPWMLPAAQAAEARLPVAGQEVTGTRIRIGPPTQVWLLKADGTHIPGLRETPARVGATNFEFPLSAETAAFAVVVRIGDQLHTWWLAAEPADER